MFWLRINQGKGSYTVLSRDISMEKKTSDFMFKILSKYWWAAKKKRSFELSRAKKQTDWVDTFS